MANQNLSQTKLCQLCSQCRQPKQVFQNTLSKIQNSLRMTHLLINQTNNKFVNIYKKRTHRKEENK